MSAAAQGNNADPQEIQKFTELAADWWDLDGTSGPLHRINPPRLKFIDEHVGGLSGKKIADIGCGGGILSEAMARAGATVTGVDMTEAVILVAREHAKAEGVEVNYQLCSAEQLAAEHAGTFDSVTCLEMLEHVPDPAAVIAACAQLVKPGGSVVFSTINRHPKAYATVVFGAEYVLGLIPKGTHDYAKFIKPAELEHWARASGLALQNMSGIQYNPLTKMGRLCRNTDTNYIMHFTRA